MGRYHLFLKRHRTRLHEVLPQGLSLQLTILGNHCQGAIFLDSSDLITPEIEEAFDQISKNIPGFFVGRYDIRFEDLEAFQQGKDYKILELNGAGGEPAHIYDPGNSIFYGYKTLFAFYRGLWRIGAYNASNGTPAKSFQTARRAFAKYRRDALNQT
jgi:hypothetical protein